MKTRFILSLCIVLVPMTVAFAATADEKAVRDADAEWSKVAGAKDLDKTVAYYADDAMILPPTPSAAANRTPTAPLEARSIASASNACARWVEL